MYINHYTFYYLMLSWNNFGLKCFNDLKIYIFIEYFIFKLIDCGGGVGVFATVLKNIFMS